MSNRDNKTTPTLAYAMIDCNNFYASCERVFDPSLIGKPIAILSNNDGCVIARSEEAKEVGVDMGAPEFKYRTMFREKGVAVRSSNYALYGDMSHRVMETLRYLAHDIEVYSIDEAFAELSTNVFPSLTEYGKVIKETIYKWTGLPVSVGIAPTKTLAKVANHIAKKNPELNGVFDFNAVDNPNSYLQEFPVNKVWGIGSRLTIKLNQHGIRTALDLKNTIHNKKWVRKQMAVTGLRTVLELNGTPCSGLGIGRESRKGILSSRMFGTPLYNLDEIQEALSTFTTRAAEKLRAQSSVASCIQIQLIGDKYDHNNHKYKFSDYHSISTPTAHTPSLISIAQKLAAGLFDPGRKYKKAAVMLTGIIPASEVQADLFNLERYTVKQHQLMESLDKINAKFGRNHAAFAATGLHKEGDHRNKWLMNQNYLSKRYTTRWDELMVVKAS